MALTEKKIDIANDVAGNPLPSTTEQHLVFQRPDGKVIQGVAIVDSNGDFATGGLNSVSITEGGNTASVLNLTSNDPLAVAILDGNGDQITSFGGGTQYADGTSVATPTGTAMLGHDGSAVQVVKTDSNGVIAIQDNGGAITVDGSVTAAVTGTVAIDQSTPGTTNAIVVTDATGKELDLRSENENWNAADHGILMFGRDAESVPNKYRALRLSPEGDVHVDLSDINGIEPDVGTGAASTGTLRVAVATDSVHAVKIQDGAGTGLTSHAPGAAKALDVSIVDGSGNQITSFGGGTQYADGAVRGTATGTLMMGDDATNIQSLKCDSNGVLAIQDNGGAITIDGSVTATVTGTVTANAGTNLNTSTLAIESGGNLAASATSLAILDDWDETDRCKVNPIAGQAGVQGGSGTVTALTQRVVLATDVALPTGANAIGKLAANSGVDIGDVDVLSMPAVAQATASNLNAQVVGNVAHDGADSGNPVKIGAIARTANPTAATATRRTDIFADDVGRLVVQPMQCRDLVASQTTTIASSSAETTVVSQIASTFCDITQINITTATATAHTATLRTATGGTTIAIFAIAANGGVSVTYPVPLPQAAVNTNWTIQLSSAAVTDYINVQYVKNV